VADSSNQIIPEAEIPHISVVTESIENKQQQQLENPKESVEAESL